MSEKFTTRMWGTLAGWSLCYVPFPSLSLGLWNLFMKLHARSIGGVWPPPPPVDGAGFILRNRSFYPTHSEQEYV